ncbi:hypothetical protein QFC20_006804 [Naganishia adeliensis]|uniref:Uncharacterized protein n=1 Tax=Naganishia adeliensis TaxID=92952 RepID=A0ACC2V847_9TREE|nr:hypothetical protein QFC20_006804 [Naganishia adeliensis]
MPRQPFGDLLNPQSPAGRGNSSSRGRGGGGGRGRGGKAKQDYSDVPPIDYNAINRQTYKQIDGFAPSSFSGGRGSSSPSPFRGGGRGKPRGGASSPFTPSRNSPDIRPGNENNSGSATPHYGVGFGGGGRGRGRGAWNPIASAMRGRGTGRMRGIMGDLEAADLRNMMAPVFVKAGTLFTEDEPEGDPIQDSHLVRESGVQEVIDLTGSGIEQDDDALEDEFSIEPASETVVLAVAPIDVDAEIPATVIAHEETEVIVSGNESGTDLMLSRTMDEVCIADDVIEIDEEIVIIEQPLLATGPVEEEEAEEEAPLFYPIKSSLTRLITSAIIGEKESSEDEEEEEVIYAPRKYAKPEPISLPSHSAPSTSRATGQKGHQTGAHAQNYMSVPFNGRPVATKSEKSKMQGKTKQQKKKLNRKARQEERIRKTEGLPRIGDSDIDWGSDGPPAAARGAEDVDSSEEDVPAFAGLGSRIRRDEQAIMQDYVQNAFGKQVESDSDAAGTDGIDMDALARFAEGMKHPRHVTLDDVADQQKHQQEDEDEGWVDSSGSELSDEEEDSADAPPNMVEIAPGLFAEVPSGNVGGDSEEEVELELDDEEDSSDDEMTGVRWVEEDSEEDELDESPEDEIDKLFRGKRNAWASLTDDYIAQIQDVLDSEDVLASGSRKQRNKLFKSVHNGDFGDDWDLAPAPKGKKAKMKGVPKELQGQWEKDRQKKADKKRQRELDRLEAAMSLYPASKKGKGKGKKGKPRFGFDDSDSDEDMTPRRKKGIQPVTDMGSLNQEIRSFILDLGKTTMTLPPMEKFSRKRVHELAACYSLKSQSKGKGRGRFPILIKTSYSSLQVNEHKINNIVGSDTPGKFYKAKYGGNAGKGPQMPGGAGRSGQAVRHQEDDAVGRDASAIGSENVGHKLLSRMGWNQGDRIGLSGGLQAPIVAIVKTTKLGLGA